MTSPVDEIKSRIDIVDLVSESVQLRRSGKNYLGFCPFHSNTRTPAFVVFPDTGTWRCFGECNEGGDIFKFVMKKEGWDFAETLRFLAQKAGVILRQPTEQEQQQAEEYERLRTLLEEAVTFYRHNLLNTAMGKPALAYLEGRGLDTRTIERFGLGYAPDSWDATIKFFTGKGYSMEDLLAVGLVTAREGGGYYDRFRNRIMIPIRDEQGRMAGFGARVLDPNDLPKFLNSPQTELFDKGKLLYGLDLARKAIREAEQAIIVEGYFDVIVPHQHGFANVVSPMGTALTEDQLRLLKRYTRNIVLAMDADAAGEKATLRGLEVARQSMDYSGDVVFDARGLMRHEARLQADIRVVTLPEGMDPDDLINQDESAWTSLIASAKPVVEHVMETLVAQQDVNDPKVKSDIAAQVLPLIEEVPDPVERDSYRQKLARLLKVDERSLLATPVIRKRRSRRSASTPRKAAAESVTSQPALAVSDAREAYCIGVLLRQPELMYRANRMLRRADLDRLTSEDFQIREHREIFRLIHKSLLQDECEPLEYVLNNLTLDAMPIADRILAQTSDIDLEKTDVLEDLIRAIIKLREDNLSQNLAYMRFLLEEAQDAGDLKATEYQQTIVHHTKMLAKLHKAMSQVSRRI